MRTSVRAAVYLFGWVQLSIAACRGVTVTPVVVSPSEPINGENATLKCVAEGYDSSLHAWTWQTKPSNGSFVDIAASERIAFLPAQRESPTNYSGIMVIKRLEKSDEGTYQCAVVLTDSGAIVANRAGDLFVNYPNEFPVCYPDGAADVREGEALSCKTVIAERTPVVRLIDDPEGTGGMGWVETPAGGTVPGSELQKNATLADDGHTFDCYSILGDIRKTLSCRIGPLTVTSPTASPTTSPTKSPTKSPLDPNSTGLPIAVIAGIVVGALLLLLLVLLFALCCGCSPRRCLRPKTYLLNFTGIFGPSSRDEDGGSADGGMELGQDALPGSPSGDQRAFTLQGVAEGDPAPRSPAAEPNVYAEHSAPGPSTSQFVSDPSENWHEIPLKGGSALTLDDEDEDY